MIGQKVDLASSNQIDNHRCNVLAMFECLIVVTSLRRVHARSPSFRLMRKLVCTSKYLARVECAFGRRTSSSHQRTARPNRCLIGKAKARSTGRGNLHNQTVADLDLHRTRLISGNAGAPSLLWMPAAAAHLSIFVNAKVVFVAMTFKINQQVVTGRLQAGAGAVRCPARLRVVLQKCAVPTISGNTMAHAGRLCRGGR